VSLADRGGGSDHVSLADRGGGSDHVSLADRGGGSEHEPLVVDGDSDSEAPAVAESGRLDKRTIEDVDQESAGGAKRARGEAAGSAWFETPPPGPSGLSKEEGIELSDDDD
jgi:hypothetical protein